MNKSELRTGNIVFATDMFGAKLYCKMLTAFQIERYHESYEPIEMNEHLISCCNLANDSLHLFEFNRKCELSIIGNSYDYNGLFVGKIPLHRFQNLFNDLTGEELEITL